MQLQFLEKLNMEEQEEKEEDYLFGVRPLSTTNVQYISKTKLCSVEQIILEGGGLSTAIYRVHRPLHPEATATFVSVKRKKFIYNSVDCELIQIVDVTTQLQFNDAKSNLELLKAL